MLTFDQIQQTVAAYFKDKPVKKVWLFGSYARGEATEESDVDLLFTFKEGTRMDYFTLARYAIDMEEALQKQVDIVMEKTLFKRVAPYVLQDRQLLYSAA